MSDNTLVIQRVDINHSPPEALEQVPGIGPKLAERILAARPFSSIEDLMRVSGIGPQSLERIRPYLTVSPPETMALTEEAAQSESIDAGGESVEAGGAGRPPAETTVVQAPSSENAPAAGEPKMTQAEVGEAVPSEEVPVKPASEKLPTRRDLTTWVVVSNLVTLFLALFLSLLFLWLVNGSLRFATMSEFRQLRADTAVLTDRLDRLQSSLDDLNSRAAALERDTSNLRGGLEAAQKEVQALRTLVDTMDERISAVEKSSQRFDKFLEGLRQLLTQVQSP